MKILTKKPKLSLSDAALVVLPVTPKELTEERKSAKAQSFKVGSRLAQLDASLKGTLRDALKAAKFKGSNAQAFAVHAVIDGSPSTVALFGWEEKKGAHFESVAQFRSLGSSIADLAKRRGAETITMLECPVSLLKEENAIAFIEGLVLSGYSFESYKSKQDDQKFELKSITLESVKQLPQRLIDIALLGCQATAFARDLVNTPPRDCTPSFLASQCKKIAKEQRLSIDVFDERALKKMGAGSLLSVAQGSEEPPYLIRMVYRPKKKSKRVISLVGKGVTFDSGGLSIKSGGGMETMKCDMSGAAAVMSVMSIITELSPHFEVRAYIPTTENMINGRATRPGDVVKAMSGKTIEILNTDAEGRLILADAIHLAEKDRSSVIIDLATLTGACMVALGTEYAGLFSNDDKLAARLLAAGDSAGEHLWRMPLVKEYKEWIKSPIADIKNIGKSSGGAITGALFLEEFIDKAEWAHLDIAGPAFTDADRGHIRRGGVGFGARTLINYLRAL